MSIRKWVIAGSSLLVVAAVLGWVYWHQPDFSRRVFRIGWMNSPPFQLPGHDGGPSGISVDLVNQAARRRGVTLQWVHWNDSSESALVSKAVDLWPLITITPERLKVLHISDPYLQHEYCFLVRDDSPVRKVEDLALARIGMANVSIDARTLRLVLPSAVPGPRTSISGVIEDVCTGSTNAAFMDRYTAISALLGQSGCGGHTLRWVSIPQVRSQLGVGSTFEASAAADAIREEIGTIAQEGKLGGFFGQWGFMSNQDLASVETLLGSRRREARLATAALVFALMFLLACWQTLRLMRERDRNRQTEQALRESQDRYMQAQKLESIGRLAGGVAHDFNNLLTVINGYSDLVYNELSESDPLRVQINEIRKAGGRAAELTQQLLAFGRKQLGRPKALNLNSLVKESENMFRRLLGEDIQVITRMDPTLGLVMADPGHMHQVLMNLAVNARDAMPNGGALIIETANALVDKKDAVSLTFSDTGAGMDETTRKNVFEPFFTTKGPNKGTGLGLATVYGIVQQSHGRIDVMSAPGKGATFRIFLPRVEPPDGPPTTPAPITRSQQGTETILVVEDQEEVRDFVVNALASRGYRVLQAPDGVQALELSQRHSASIDVLLTDVILPGMNGRELADQFRVARPGIKVLYTSGYTQDVIANRGVLHRDVAYIAKPYTADQIAAKVREAIGR